MSATKNSVPHGTDELAVWIRNLLPDPDIHRHSTWTVVQGEALPSRLPAALTAIQPWLRATFESCEGEVLLSAQTCEGGWTLTFVLSSSSLPSARGFPWFEQVIQPVIRDGGEFHFELTAGGCAQIRFGFPIPHETVSTKERAA